jgi:hypothetical protein
MRARTGLWEPRGGNDPGPPGPTHRTAGESKVTKSAPWDPERPGTQEPFCQSLRGSHRATPRLDFWGVQTKVSGGGSLETRFSHGAVFALGSRLAPTDVRANPVTKTGRHPCPGSSKPGGQLCCFRSPGIARWPYTPAVRDLSWQGAFRFGGQNVTRGPWLASSARQWQPFSIPFRLGECGLGSFLSGATGGRSSGPFGLRAPPPAGPVRQMTEGLGRQRVPDWFALDLHLVCGWFAPKRGMSIFVQTNFQTQKRSQAVGVSMPR